MAVIATNSVTYGTLTYTAFVPFAQTVGDLSFGAMALFNPQPSYATRFRQRVWDTVNLVWCYYTSLAIDPTPTTSETSPVNSGSITAHSVIGIDNDVEQAQ